MCKVEYPSVADLLAAERDAQPPVVAPPPSGRTWTCQRQTDGVKCRAQNPARRQLCAACGKRRPAYRRQAHRAALKRPYPEWVADYGEACGICGAGRKPGCRALHRDHDHASAVERGLLCFRCNSVLRAYMTLDWMRAAVVYLERAADVAEHPQ